MQRSHSHRSAAGTFPCRTRPHLQLLGRLCFLLAGLSLAGSGLAADLPLFRPDRVLVKFKAGGTSRLSAATSGVRILQSFPEMGSVQVLEVPPGESPLETIAQLEASGLVEYAEPDYLVHALAAPNDFRYQDNSLWGLNNLGILDGSPAGVVDADIDAPEAWDIRTDASGVIVAVIDTGIRATHEDLAANLWTNSGEIPGNGLDDDFDGYVDDVHGINALLDNSNPVDDWGHGSHVAGIIGAYGNNGIGVVGVAWRARLMVLKLLDSAGNGSVSDAIECIDYARVHGAKVINASWGGAGYQSQALQDAIAAAGAADILFVAAAGNSNRDNDLDPLYPASFTLDNIIAVAATDRDDHRAFYSHWGAQSVDLGAPGSAIFSCWNGSDSDYRYNDGTSMAAAMVSGACAILRAQFPAESHTQIIQRLLANIDPLPDLAGKTVSGGRLNLAKALAAGAPATPFDTWRSVHFGSSVGDPAVGGASADPDRDGYSNLVEYAAGSDPNLHDAALFSSGLIQVGDQFHLTLTFPHNPGATDVRTTVQVSGDLAAWLSGSAYGRGGDVPANTQTTELSRTGTNPETITVRDNTDLPPAGGRFMRLVIELP